MSVPYIFGSIPNGNAIPLSYLDANFNYLTTDPTFSGNVSISGTLSVAGAAAFSSTISASSLTLTSGNLTLSGASSYVTAAANTSYFGAGNILISGGAAGDTGVLTAGNILFGTNAGAGNFERARIDSSGNFGIGTTSPGSRLDIAGGAWVQSNNAEMFNFTTRTGAGADLNYIGNLTWQANNSSNTLKPYVKLLVQQITSTAGNENGALYLQASKAGTLFTGLEISGNTDAVIFGNSGGERARIDSNGNVVINTAAIATNATDGFLYVPTCAGTPTGTPTTYTGRAPIVVNTTNNKLYFYSGGAWRDAGP